jgi:hypothetical protein
VDLLPLLTGEAEGLPDRLLYWRFNRSRAVRDAEWNATLMPKLWGWDESFPVYDPGMGQRPWAIALFSSLPDGCHAVAEDEGGLKYIRRTRNCSSTAWVARIPVLLYDSVVQFKHRASIRSGLRSAFALRLLHRDK